MGEIDTFGLYVKERLEEWGRAFALHRDCEYLGHQSKNMLQVLIEHRGEMPPPPTGFKPLELPTKELQIENIVADIARVNLTRATVLRAYYCGAGRKGAERLDTANEMLEKMGRQRLSRVKYFAEHDFGFEAVRWSLNGIARAA